MIRTAAEMTVDVRPRLRGGEGDTTIRTCFRPEEFGARLRLCATLTLPPGASIGPHAHDGEDEIYLILRGRGLVDDAGRKDVRVTVGDAVLTGKGATHAIRNDGTEPLELAAIIVLY
jgi:mannose-6-phosphate isomerase-like protein (cupin superfamily)